jgi:hypothetical protein
MTRDELIRAMARRYDPYAFIEGRPLEDKAGAILWAGDELKALEAAIPGLSRLLDGTHVVVPREPTKAMLLAPVDGQSLFAAKAQEQWFAEIYAAMIAAQENGNDRK